jgi:hypothetical protein
VAPQATVKAVNFHPRSSPVILAWSQDRILTTLHGSRNLPRYGLKHPSRIWGKINEPVFVVTRPMVTRWLCFSEFRNDVVRITMQPVCVQEKPEEPGLVLASDSDAQARQSRCA